MTTESHVHLDIPTSHATFVRHAIAEALRLNPSAFDDEQMLALTEIEMQLMLAVDTELDS